MMVKNKLVALSLLMLVCVACVSPLNLSIVRAGDEDSYYLNLTVSAPVNGTSYNSSSVGWVVSASGNDTVFEYDINVYNGSGYSTALWFVNASSPSGSISGLANGDYMFAVGVTGNNWAKNYSEIYFSVNVSSSVIYVYNVTIHEPFAKSYVSGSSVAWNVTSSGNDSVVVGGLAVRLYRAFWSNSTFPSEPYWSWSYTVQASGSFEGLVDGYYLFTARVVGVHSMDEKSVFFTVSSLGGPSGPSSPENKSDDSENKTSTEYFFDVVDTSARLLIQELSSVPLWAWLAVVGMLASVFLAAAWNGNRKGRVKTPTTRRRR